MEPPTTNTQRKGLPRSLQFQRMERIVKAMQHPTAGVPVRSQKLFLTTVPNAFTGNDVSEWIAQKLNVKDSGKLFLNEIGRFRFSLYS
jgi:regulator of G-protein signaling